MLSLAYSLGVYTDFGTKYVKRDKETFFVAIKTKFFHKLRIYAVSKNNVLDY